MTAFKRKWIGALKTLLNMRLETASEARKFRDRGVPISVFNDAATTPEEIAAGAPEQEHYNNWDEVVADSDARVEEIIRYIARTVVTDSTLTTTQAELTEEQYAKIRPSILDGSWFDHLGSEKS